MKSERKSVAPAAIASIARRSTSPSPLRVEGKRAACSRNPSRRNEKSIPAPATKRFSAIGSSDVYALHASAAVRSIAGGTAERELNRVTMSGSGIVPRGSEDQTMERWRALLRRTRR